VYKNFVTGMNLDLTMREECRWRIYIIHIACSL